MNTRLLGAALLLLAVVAWLLWSSFDGPPVVPGPTVSAPADSASAATATLAPDAKVVNEGLERTPADVSSGNTWVVRGEVMHGSVAPLSDAHFTARAFSGWQAGEKPLHEATLVSDANGAFEWAMPMPSGTVTLQFVQARADTAIIADSRTVLAGEGPPQDVTVFAFLKDCQVTGAVTDQAGRPIAGAWVKGGSRDVPEPCDAAGNYVLLTSATYGDATVVAGAPGYVLGRQHVKVKGRSARVVVNFELKAAVRLVGRITDEAGAPVAGASVFTYETYSAQARTDADGRYELAHIDSLGEQHTVQVDHDDYLTAQRTLTRAQLSDPCDLVMKHGAVVSGRVVADSDRPVAGAHIHLGEGIGYVGNPRAVSREDGTFEVRNARPGDASMTIFARGYAPDRRFVAVPEGKTEVPSILVRLESGHFVAGRVVDRGGKGLHRVRVIPLAVLGRRGQVGAETYTAKDGSFRITDLPAGKVNLDCFGMQSTRKEEQVDVDRDDVTVVMEPPARLAGRVLDDATGAPLARFSIRFVTPDLRSGERQGGGYGVEWAKGLVFENCDGYWNTDSERLEAGTVFGVEASAEGYGPVVVRRAQPQVDAAPDALVMRLRPASRIVGRVVDQRTGAGIAGAQLTVFSADFPIAGRDPADGARRICRTGDDGAFELTGVPAGQLSLALQHADWPLTFDGPFQTAPGTTTTRVLSVRAGATLTGTVLDLQGNPLAGVNVARQMVDIQGLRVPHASVTTDGKGRFQFPALPSSRYWLVASALLADGSTIVYSRNVDVTLGEDLDLQLQPEGRGALQVDFSSEQALPASISLYISRPAATRDERPFCCSASGSSIIVRGLPPGEFRVFASSDGTTSTVSGSGSVNLSGEQPARVSIPLTTRMR